MVSDWLVRYGTSIFIRNLAPGNFVALRTIILIIVLKQGALAQNTCRYVLQAGLNDSINTVGLDGRDGGKDQIIEYFCQTNRWKNNYHFFAWLVSLVLVATQLSADIFFTSHGTYPIFLKNF
jgi:hypothetical protein